MHEHCDYPTTSDDLTVACETSNWIDNVALCWVAILKSVSGDKNDTVNAPFGTLAPKRVPPLSSPLLSVTPDTFFFTAATNFDTCNGPYNDGSYVLD